MNTIADVRPSPIAGTWYTGDPARLRAQITRFLDEAKLPDLPGKVLGVITPHAGLRYSGRTAGHAFAALRGRSPELVAVVSPMHAPVAGMALTTAHRAYATPLGEVWVDRPALETLHKELIDQRIDLYPVAYDSEHSLEIELPFLQVALEGEFKLLPLMLRSQSPGVARKIGEALARTLAGRDALLVVSTDLSHFFTEEEANSLDAEMLRRIESMDPDAVLQAEQTGAGYACGAPAVAAVLWATKALGANHVSILHHSTSADETGDTRSVVGYGAAAISRQP